MTKRKFYRTVYQVEVLSEDPTPDTMSLDELHYQITDGSWSGMLTQQAKGGRLLTVESRILLERFGARRLVLESTRDISDRKAWDERQQLLLGELAHRVKNTLAVVQSIAGTPGNYTITVSVANSGTVSNATATATGYYVGYLRWPSITTSA